MNKILTFPGTQPIYLGDVDFMQNAGGSLSTALARALANADSDTFSAILQGVEITALSSEQVQYGDGIVALNGEILPVTGDTISISSSAPLYFHIVSVLSGSRTFKDGVSRDCYETRSVIVNGVSEGGIAVASVPRLYHRPDDVIYSFDSPSSAVYRKNGFWFFKRVNIDTLSSGSSAGFSEIFSIPDINAADLSEIPIGTFIGIVAVTSFDSEPTDVTTSFRVRCKFSRNVELGRLAVSISAIETVSLPDNCRGDLTIMLFPL